MKYENAAHQQLSVELMNNREGGEHFNSKLGNKEGDFKELFRIDLQSFYFCFT